MDKTIVKPFAKRFVDDFTGVNQNAKSSLGDGKGSLGDHKRTTESIEVDPADDDALAV